MRNFKITFLALSRTTEMEIKSENDISPILNNLLIAFAKEIDCKNKKIIH
mgnify:CR=1 FL=1